MFDLYITQLQHAAAFFRAQHLTFFQILVLALLGLIVNLLICIQLQLVTADSRSGFRRVMANTMANQKTPRIYAHLQPRVSSQHFAARFNDPGRN